MKQEEQNKIGWSAKRELARINYHIHTDAVRNKLVPTEVSMSQKNTIYAEEADVLNVAIRGQNNLCQSAKSEVKEISAFPCAFAREEIMDAANHVHIKF